jgi:hypothetical protein
MRQLCGVTVPGGSGHLQEYAMGPGEEGEWPGEENVAVELAAILLV